MGDRSTLQRQAETFFREKRFDQALGAYRELHNETGESKHLYNIAICLYHVSRIGDASAILEKLWSKRILAPDSGLFLGFCYRHLSQFGRGRAHFRAMVEETSGDVRARCRLMEVLMTDESGETSAAERGYEELLLDMDVAGRTRAEVLRRLGTLKENKKEHLAALNLYRESLSLDSDGEASLAAKFRMAVCLMEMSTPAEAVDLLRDVETSAAGSFLGESASKLRQAVESGVRRTERHIRSYE